MIKIEINEWGNPNKAYITKDIKVFGCTVYRLTRTTTSTAVTNNFHKQLKVKGYEIKDKSKEN